MRYRVLPLLAVGVLAACGPVHPGSAVVVDGESISMTRVDDAARAYCQLFVQTNPDAGVIPVGEARRQALSDLVLAKVADDVAAEEDLRPIGGGVSAAEVDQIEQLYPVDADNVVATLREVRRAYGIAQALGESEGVEDTDVEPTAARDAGLVALRQRLVKLDVDVDPRFGIDELGREVASSGSLSVSVDQLDPNALPANQRCA